MTFLSETQPTILSNSRIKTKSDLRSILQLKKPCQIKLDPIIYKHHDNSSHKVFEKICQDLGQPENKFILQKIRTISSEVLSPRMRKLFHLPRQKTESDIQSTINQNSSRRLKTMEQKHIQSVIVRNEEEKMCRLMLRYEQKQQKYQKIMNLVKTKSLPKKLRVVEKGPERISKSGWYRKWILQANNERERGKQKKIFLYRNNSKKRKCYTEGLSEIW